MSHYIVCPKCGDDSLDVDTYHCDECGYSVQEFPFEALEALIEYNWADEEKDYKRHVEENGDGTGHVFDHLKKLNDWLQANKPKKEAS